MRTLRLNPKPDLGLRVKGYEMEFSGEVIRDKKFKVCRGVQETVEALFFAPLFSFCACFLFFVEDVSFVFWCVMRRIKGLGNGILHLREFPKPTA